MASVDRTSIHAILKRARKTLVRARLKADDSNLESLADDLFQLSVELDRLIYSTAPAAIPEAASPRSCA